MVSLRRHLEHKSHIIWDWNGTLLNDITICVEVIGSLLQDHGLPTLSREEYRRRFRFPVKEFYRELGFDFSRVTFEALSEIFFERYENRIHECSLFEGVGELLHELGALKKTLSVLSAADEEHLKRLLAHFQLIQHFQHIYGLSDRLAASKIDRGRELIRQFQVPLPEIILVGDTDHDVEVARELGIDCLLIADGHQTYERLQIVHPPTLHTRFSK